MVLDKLSKIGKIGLGVFLLATLFFLLGFALPQWLSFDTGSDLGLWEICYDGACFKSTGSRVGQYGTDWPTSWFMGTQALMCLALIALIGDYVVRILYICGKPKSFLLISIILDCVTGAFALGAAILFGSETEPRLNSHLSSGFACDIVGGLLFAATAVCIFIDYIRK